MAHLTARRVLLLLLVMAVEACTTTSTFSDFDEPDFPVVVARYQAMAGAKVLALATEANGRYAWGIAANEASEAGARAGAIERCRHAARAGGMRADCFPFAVGDDPAPDTVKRCAARRLASRRCQMQRSHQGELLRKR